jgi:hypothetical protein
MRGNPSSHCGLVSIWRGPPSWRTLCRFRGWFCHFCFLVEAISAGLDLITVSHRTSRVLQRGGHDVDGRTIPCALKEGVLVSLWKASAVADSAPFTQPAMCVERRSGRVFGPAPYCPPRWPQRFPLVPRRPPGLHCPVDLLLYFVTTVDVHPPFPTDTHHRLHCCLGMPLPENTTISLHGHSRPEDAFSSKPKQAIFLRMSAETLEALQTSPLPQVQFTFGKRSVSSVPTARSPQLDPLPCRAYKWETPSFRPSHPPRT